MLSDTCIKTAKFEAAVILQVHADEDEGRPYFLTAKFWSKRSKLKNSVLTISVICKKTLKGGKHGSPNAPNENTFRKATEKKGALVDIAGRQANGNKILEMNKERSQHAKTSWNSNEVAQFMSKIVDNVANHGKNDVVEAHLNYEESLLVASFLDF